ncbi:MAG: 2-oxoglutarate dehydrogenase component [Rickettsiales bacterium]|jgi:2-oxoglutarate dehydrogenase E1 component|nr:2-oxoglutarate dehydrogenase component [Rickettsiales bacterium]
MNAKVKPEESAMADSLNATTYLFGGNTVFIEELYNRYVQDPSSVDEKWQHFFRDLGDDIQAVLRGTQGPSWAKKAPRIVGYRDPEEAKAAAAAAAKAPKNEAASSASDSIKALMLVRAYRMRGHLMAKLDPLNLEGGKGHPDLNPATYGFSEADYDRPIYLGGVLGHESATVREILATLRRTYCATIGAEFMHIESLAEREWIEARLEPVQGQFNFSAEAKREIFEKIMKAETFEQFLHVKFPGTKRFSIEGGESTIVAMDMALAKSGEHGVKEAVIGMPHRGRLNVLTSVVQKPYFSMISEFMGELAHPASMDIAGDVKYHLGKSADRDFNGNTIHLSLSPNPSHLEAVNPVVVGRVRAKQNQHNDTSRSKVVGVLLHGDAAFAGQGVVAETLSLGDLKGYTTGGTIHVIVNNQIGFTTSPKNARLSPYPTEVAKIVQAPIFHVNGDDPEAVAFVAQIAAEFRAEFKKDIVLDIICYRRYGHNEGDEPFFTQPVMYTEISEHKRPMSIYGEKLIAEGVISRAEFEKKVEDFKAFLEEERKKAEKFKPEKADFLEGKWAGLEQSKRGGKAEKSETGVKKATLEKIGKVISAIPQDFNVNPKIVRQFEAKQEMFKTGRGFDWATGEALAFGSLMLEGHPVRLTGQDAVRGTFSHRHSSIIDQKTEARYTPLAQLDPKQASLEIVDSNLSEFAVLGFEYGYSLAEPNALTLWEGQFGDFVNGAQVMIDQFITSGEVKWLRMSGLVMLLPHGYEGQGPEHSSARIERFLQSCAEDNIQVANCTTPASYYHILRRQLHRKFRKPLIIATPKSLLRHKLAVSALKDFAEGTSFEPIIGETHTIAADAKVKRVVFCSGKVYYDLLEEREKRGVQDVALVRMEQFYPFPAAEVVREVQKYKNAEIVWCQEEPKNMAGWFFVEPKIEEALIAAGIKGKRASYVGRKEAASPAAGYMKLHVVEQKALIDQALTVK